MLADSELAILAGRSYSGPQSGTVALDVQYDLVPRDREIVVVMPGTNPRDPLDWIRDLRVLPTWIPGIGLVHSGFGRGALAIWPTLLRYHRGLPRTVLVSYVGHSLGGALAQVLAALHARDLPQSPFRVVTFGAPRIAFLNPYVGILIRSGVEAVEYARAGDVVPNVPLRPLYGHPTRRHVIGESAYHLPWWKMLVTGSIPGAVAGNHSIARYVSDLKTLNL